MKVTQNGIKSTATSSNGISNNSSTMFHHLPTERNSHWRAAADDPTDEVRNDEFDMSGAGANDVDGSEFDEVVRDLPSYDDYDDDGHSAVGGSYDDMLTTSASSTDELVFVNGALQKERDVMLSSPTELVQNDSEADMLCLRRTSGIDTAEVRNTPFLLSRSNAWSQDSLDQRAFYRTGSDQSSSNRLQQLYSKSSSSRNATWPARSNPTYIHWEEKVTDSDGDIVLPIIQYAIDLVEDGTNNF